MPLAAGAARRRTSASPRAVGLAFAVAASTFCPLLVLGIWWRGLTDAGALAGLLVGGVAVRRGGASDACSAHRASGWLGGPARPAGRVDRAAGVRARWSASRWLTRHRVPAHVAAVHGPAAHPRGRRSSTAAEPARRVSRPTVRRAATAARRRADPAGRRTCPDRLHRRARPVPTREGRHTMSAPDQPHATKATGPRTTHEQAHRHDPVYDRLHETAEFTELRRRYRGFVFPATVAFLAWYLLYVVMSIWAHDFMSTASSRATSTSPWSSGCSSSSPRSCSPALQPRSPTSASTRWPASSTTTTTLNKRGGPHERASAP